MTSGNWTSRSQRSSFSWRWVTTHMMMGQGASPGWIASAGKPDIRDGKFNVYFDP